MKKRNKLLMIILGWVIVAIIMYKYGLLTFDSEKIRAILSNNTVSIKLLFVLISSLRIVLLIPQTVFIIAGTFAFKTEEVFVFSVLALFLSQSMMFLVGYYFRKQIMTEDFYNKNGRLMEMIKEYGYKLLALGVICPITPSDIFTLAAACIKLDYKKTILTILLADTPMILLYCVIGGVGSLGIYIRIMGVVVVAMISFYAFIIWQKMDANFRKEAVR